MGRSGLGAGLLLALLAGAALAGSGLGLVTLSVKQGVGVRRRRVRTGAEGIIGHVGIVRQWTDLNGSLGSVVDEVEEPGELLGCCLIQDQLVSVTIGGVR